MRTQNAQWVTVDLDGLRQIAERTIEAKGFGIIGAELHQNAMDSGATRCDITLRKVQGKPLAEIVVEDDGPGFTDLTHAWTMFAPSAKKADASKAGRFNMGEKIVLAFCQSATIETTSGTVEFGPQGRSERRRSKRAKGTAFTAILRCNQAQYDQLEAFFDGLLVPQHFSLTVNGRAIPSRTAMRTFEATLDTEIGDDLRRTQRRCEVEVYAPLPGEAPSIFELGIPVVETGDRWHYNVLQRVPLNFERDNVRPAYLRHLRTVVLNEMHDVLDPDDTAETWVQEATSDGNCSSAALASFARKRFGDKAVASTPGNPEADHEAAANGYVVLSSRALTKGQRANLRDANLLPSSQQAFPLAGKGAYSNDPTDPLVQVVPEHEWSRAMRRIYDYAIGLGKKLLDAGIEVRFVLHPDRGRTGWRACYGHDDAGSGRLDFNVSALGRGWFASGISEDVDALLLHEFGHHYASDHLSIDYHRALTRLGAKLKRLAIDEPEWFAQFEQNEAAEQAA